MTYFVAMTDSPAGNDLTVERSVLSGIRVEKVEWTDRASLLVAVRDADGVMCMHAPFDESVLSAMRRCRVIARFGTGLDNIDQKAAAAAGIAVVGVPDYCTQEVANHTMALILAWNRRVLEYHEFVQQKRWNERTETTGNWGCGPLSRLSKLTLGLLGFGRIGQAVAQRARAFGMNVLVYSRRPDMDLARAMGVEVTTLEDLLRRSDFVSLHVPLTPETRGLFDAEKIDMMRPDAVLINTARGALLDEQELAKALSDGRLGGALLDVYERAPLPLDHPYRRLRNVILTPHVAFYSEEALLELRRRTAEGVLRHLRP